MALDNPIQYCFDDFLLDTASFELSANGEVVAAEPQVIQLLALLVQNAGHMVAKEDIHQSIWAGRYVSEAALSSRIRSLRQLLGDDGKTQKYIKTVHKKGFRFVAEVQVRQQDNQGAKDAAAQKITISRPRILILPFHNLSNQASQEYFSDGISTDIITMLSKHKWLEVIARNTSFGYKKQVIDVRELATELRLNYLVEGSVQLVDKRIRINCHLIDSSEGLQIWGEKYDRELSDVFALQDEITETIVSRLEPEIGFAERNKVVMSRPANLQAWDCYHLGIYHFFKFTGQDNIEAQRLLKQSQSLDDNFGEAYAWWAYAVVLGMVYWQTQPTQPLLDQALAACDKALSLDRQNATFYALRARVKLARCEYQGAITENNMAISLNPTFAAAHCGLGDSLAYEGRYEESIESFKHAISLSPNDPQMWAFLTYGALACIFKRDFAQALAWCDQAYSIPNCQYWTLAHKVVALAYLGNLDAAARVTQELLDSMPEFSIAFAEQKLFYLKMPEQKAMYLQGLSMAGLS